MDDLENKAQTRVLALAPLTVSSLPCCLAGLTIMFISNCASITYKKFLWIWKIRYLKPTISGGYFFVWRIDFYFFPLAVSNGTEGNVNPFCLLLCFCSWLLISGYVWLCCSLGLVSGYYKVMRKRNNHKALVLRGWNEQKDREKKKNTYLGKEYTW